MVEIEDCASKVVIIDNGSSIIKAGFSGDEAPTATIPTVIGHNRNPNAGDLKPRYFGQEAIS